MKKQRYITVVHAKGATLGYDGPFVPVSHRFFWDGTRAQGAQSLTRLFRSEQEMVMHFQKFIGSDSGEFGDFKWTSE